MIGAKGVELGGMASMLQWKGFLPTRDSLVCQKSLLHV